jgi:hypothetical protein
MSIIQATQEALSRRIAAWAKSMRPYLKTTEARRAGAKLKSNSHCKEEALSYHK